ncbi:hypothetical protein FVE85_0024 [Porphyridium purpureum]|uniref:Uncharacterized protein n=1 Tax=Porphyridium purpureum TaxID=35688 RepID=A0A5J4YYU6_PORPP|nr:hypothetical protein FVE85_0024 [Porphyridium purpureum]|eukprot:POR6766..scf208_2
MSPAATLAATVLCVVHPYSSWDCPAGRTDKSFSKHPQTDTRVAKKSRLASPKEAFNSRRDKWIDTSASRLATGVGAYEHAVVRYYPHALTRMSQKLVVSARGDCLACPLTLLESSAYRRRHGVRITQAKSYAK